MINKEKILLENQLDSSCVSEFRNRIIPCDDCLKEEKSKRIYKLLKQKKLDANKLKEIEDLLLEGANPNYQNQDKSKSKDRPKGYSLLFVAASKGHKDVVNMLLRAGALVDLSTTYGSTPLLRAARNNRIEVASILLAMGADINHANHYGSTSLMWAARNGHEDMMDLLLDNQASVNLASLDGDTALISASRHNQYNSSIKLVEAGAYMNAVNIVGETALSVTTDNDLTSYFRSVMIKAGEPNIDHIVDESFEQIMNDCLNVVPIISEKTKTKKI